MSRLKLNLRDLFWLVALAALGLGWYQERQTARRSLYQVKYELLQVHQARQAMGYIFTSSPPMIHPAGAAKASRPALTEAEIDSALKQFGVVQPTNLSP